MAYIPIPLPVSARRARLPSLPIWLFWYSILSFCHAAYVSLDSRRADVVGIAALPMAWFMLERVLTLGRDRDEGRPWKLSAFLALAALAMPITVLFAPHNPAPAAVFRASYEATGILGAAGVFAWVFAQDRRAAMVFFGAGLLYGLVLENSGILLGFFHEGGYALYLPPFVAPVVTIVGWSTAMFLSCWYVLRLRRDLPRLLGTPLRAAIAATLFALSFDAVVDPVAAQVGLWEWHPSLSLGPLGVPPVNWIAWTCAVLPFAHLVFRIAPDGRLDDRRVRLVFRGTPLALCYAATAFVAVTLLLEGARGPSWELLNLATSRLLAFAGM